MSTIATTPVNLSNTRTPFNAALLAATVVGLILSAANFAMPRGTFLPTPLLLAQISAFGVMLMMHLTRHLGVRALPLYFVVVGGIEFMTEQIDMHSDGIWYGAHFDYTEVLGPQILGVPIGSPLALIVLLWPVHCITTTILEGRVVASHRGQPWVRTILVAGVAGFFFSWMPFVIEQICLNIGAYTYPQIEAGTVPSGWFGAPAGAFYGWWAMVFLQEIALLRWIGPRYASGQTVTLHPALDFAPYAFFAILSVSLATLAVNSESRIATIYTGCVYSLLGLIFFVRALEAAPPPHRGQYLVNERPTRRSRNS